MIARLRHEDDKTNVQYELPHLEMQFPALHRTLSGSTTSSPSQAFSEPAPISNPSSLGGSPGVLPYGPTSVPMLHPQALPPFRQSISLEHPSASSSDYVTVNDLAHQIFHDGLSTSPDVGILSLQSRSPPPRPTSIDALLNNRSVNSQSPSNYSGPKFLYRSNSVDQVEPQISIVAAEIEMSSYLMSQCVKQYFQHLYPIMPILHETTLRGRLDDIVPLPLDEKMLLISLCAITVLHAAPQTDLGLDAKQRLGKRFLHHCLHMRSDGEWIEHAGLTDIITSFFISISFFELKKPRTHHFYLREAIGTAHEKGYHLESLYEQLDHTQRICFRRTFAVLFITERGCAILRNKPISITSLPLLPTEHFEDEDPSVLAGFQCLCRLFALLDEKFVELWRMAAPDVDAMIQADNIAAIQHGLNTMSFEPMTAIQKADVLITHQWLRLIFWQASIRQGLISGSAEDPAFGYEYPITIAKALCVVMQELSLESILVHGLGIFEKIFEVAYTLMDALMIANTPWTTSEELRFLFRCLSASPNSHNIYVKMLQTKIESQSNLQDVVDRQNGTIDGLELINTQFGY